MELSTLTKGLSAEREHTFSSVHFDRAFWNTIEDPVIAVPSRNCTEMTYSSLCIVSTTMPPLARFYPVKGAAVRPNRAPSEP
eukprot:m.365630 g.365630  ORF g.365630 m.365630 type:complete len:82 (-) comp16656_c0_seq21:1539-1784(-)